MHVEQIFSVRLAMRINDFSVIGCDDVLSASTYPALTSISARCDEAGRIAAELLTSTLQTGKRSNVRCRLDTWLVTRDTTAPAPKTAFCHPGKTTRRSSQRSS
jgi:DNA-binding LacI/PurR family transcriptional regulator